MEELIAQGYFAAVLDYTLSEVAGYVAGGFHNGGATRLDAAAKAGIPQVIVPGCLDFMVFGAKHEVPEQFRDRPTYYHNPEFTLVRVTPEEQLKAVAFVVEKLNRAQSPGDGHGSAQAADRLWTSTVGLSGGRKSIDAVTRRCATG